MLPWDLAEAERKKVGVPEHETQTNGSFPEPTQSQRIRPGLFGTLPANGPLEFVAPNRDALPQLEPGNRVPIDILNFKLYATASRGRVIKDQFFPDEVQRPGDELTTCGVCIDG